MATPAIAVRPILFLLGAGALFAGCSLAPRTSLPEPVSELPGDFSERLAEGPHEPEAWWHAFGDPTLNAVVDSALVSNFDLAAGIARVQQARARARIARAAYFPAVQAGGGVNDIDSPTNAGIGAQIQELGLGGNQSDFPVPFTLPDRLALTTYTLSADFSYELDFWGRVRNDALAAGAEYLASESDFHAARIGILSETIATWFEIADLRRQTALAREMADVLLEQEQLALARYREGLAGSSYLYRVRQELRNAQAGLPQLESLLASAEGRLSVLLGGYRVDMEALFPDALTPSPVADPVPAGVPADLLLQRPDVIAAGRRLDAARYAIGARRAELLPTFSFSGSIGLQSTEVDGLFNADQWFRNLIGNLTAPVIQGSRLRSNVALAHARFDEMAAAYGRTVVTAVNEVEAALAGLENATQRHAFLDSRLQQAQASEALKSRRYASGIDSYTDYLNVLLTRLNVASALAGAERDLALARLAVHRALGGAWTAPDSPDAPRMTAAQPVSNREE